MWLTICPRVQGSAHVPGSVNFNTQHQLGDPALLGVALQERLRRQEHRALKQRRKAAEIYKQKEALREQQAGAIAGEGVGTTDGVETAAVATAEADGRADRKRRKDDEVESGGGSATK